MQWGTEGTPSKSPTFTKYQQPSPQPELGLRASRGRVSTTAGSARYVATARDNIPIAAILGPMPTQGHFPRSETEARLSCSELSSQGPCTHLWSKASRASQTKRKALLGSPGLSRHASSRKTASSRLSLEPTAAKTPKLPGSPGAASSFTPAGHADRSEASSRQGVREQRAFQLHAKQLVAATEPDRATCTSIACNCGRSRS